MGGSIGLRLFVVYNVNVLPFHVFEVCTTYTHMVKFYPKIQIGQIGFKTYASIFSNITNKLYSSR